MKLDRNLNANGRGKYALLKIPDGAENMIAGALAKALIDQSAVSNVTITRCRINDVDEPAVGPVVLKGMR